MLEKQIKQNGKYRWRLNLNVWYLLQMVKTASNTLLLDKTIVKNTSDRKVGIKTKKTVWKRHVIKKFRSRSKIFFRTTFFAFNIYNGFQR